MKRNHNNNKASSTSVNEKKQKSAKRQPWGIFRENTAILFFAEGMTDGTAAETAVAEAVEVRGVPATMRAVALAAGVDCAAASRALDAYAGAHAERAAACVALAGTLRTGGHAIVLCGAQDAPTRAAAFAEAPARTVVAVVPARGTPDAAGAAEAVWAAAHAAARPWLQRARSTADAAESPLLSGALDGVVAPSGAPLPRTLPSYSVAVTVSFAGDSAAAPRKAAAATASATTTTATGSSSSGSAAGSKGGAGAHTGKDRGKGKSLAKGKGRGGSSGDLGHFFAAAATAAADAGTTARDEKSESKNKNSRGGGARRVVDSDSESDDDDGDDTDDDAAREAAMLRRDEAAARADAEALLFAEGGGDADVMQDDAPAAVPQETAEAEAVPAQETAAPQEAEEEKPRMVLDENGYYVMAKGPAPKPAPTPAAPAASATASAKKTKTAAAPAAKKKRTQQQQQQHAQKSISSFFTAL